MQTLLIEVDGRVLRLAEDRVFRIGRSIDADIVLSAMSVSRAHAELRPTPSGWVLVDVGSSGGTFVDQQQISELPVTGPIQVQCGPAGPGSDFSITPESQASAELSGMRSVAPMAPPMPAPYAPPAAGAPSGTAAPGAPAGPEAAGPPPAGPPSVGGAAAGPPPGAAPGDAYGPPPGAGSMPPPTGAPGGSPQPAEPLGGYDMTIAPGSVAPVLPGQMPQQTGPDLLVVVEGREYRFRHPASISVGRHPECDVVVEDRSVSRHHGQIAATEDGWVYQNASEDGSYAGGRAVTNEPFDETMKVRLGHPVAGEELTLVPILSAEEELRRFAAKRRKKRLLIGGAVAAALVLIGGTVVAAVTLGGDDGGPADSMAELTTEEAAAVKSASVFILTPDGNDETQVSATGSGSIISSDGKILTNAHVADPGAIEEFAAEGVTTPDFVLVSLTDPEQNYKASEDDLYRAEIVESDGELDVAVVQIYAKADGTEVDPSSLDLPVMELGDSDQVQQGDAINVFGFPGISRAEDMDELSDAFIQVSQTEGEVATIVPLGGDDRGVFDVTARIAPGNSGGGAVDNDGRLVGVPTRIQMDTGGSPVASGRVAPLDFLSSVIEAAGVEVP